MGQLFFTPSLHEWARTNMIIADLVRTARAGQYSPCIMMVHDIVQQIRDFLGKKRLPAILASFAVLISLPTVFSGFEPLDDLRHRSKLLNPAQLPPQMFDTGMIPENSGELTTVLHELHSNVYTKDNVQKQKDYGVLPWWTRQDYKASNWRPLDSFTHWLDYRLYPNTSALIHLHNVLWFAVVIFLLTVLYKEFLAPQWLAGLAAVLYLLDDSNCIPAAWIANRNLLIAIAFTVLTILAHHKWRRDSSIVAAFVAPLCLLCSLLATEAGIAAFAYLFAYAVALDRARWFKRALSLLPALLVMISWRLIYNHLGHGAFTSGFILDPAREPLRFAWLVLVRAPVLLFAQWTPFPADMFGFLFPPEQIYGWGIAVIFLVILVVVFIPLLIKDKLARFWLVAMLCCAVPICASAPMNRNLLFVAIGAFGLMAQFVGAVLTNASYLIKSRFTKVASIGMLVFLLLSHIVLSAVGRIVQPIILSSVHDSFEATMQIGSPPGLQDKTVVFINCPNPFAISYLPPYRAHYNLPLPKSIRIIATGFNMYFIRRSGPNTLHLSLYKGNIMQNYKRTTAWSVNFFKMFTGSFRDCDAFPINPGDKFELPGFTAKVIKVDKTGRPTKVIYKFDRPLDDSSLIWLQWDWLEKRYHTFQMPRDSRRITIPGPPRRKTPEKQ